MLLDHILQHGIFLVIGKSRTQDLTLAIDVMDQRTSTQFDVIWMSAEEKYAFAVEDHDLFFSDTPARPVMPGRADFTDGTGFYPLETEKSPCFSALSVSHFFHHPIDICI